MSAAFDTIDYGILLNRLCNQLGVEGTTLEWFTSYLTNHTQCISIDGEKSLPKKLSCGVPQRSVLEPLLFSAYLSELGHIIRDFNINFHSYADDTQLYIAFKRGDSNITIERLEMFITKIKFWMFENKLKLNDDKSEFMLITSPHNSKKFNSLSIHIGSEIVETTSSAQNFGVIVTNLGNCDVYMCMKADE